MKYKTSKRKYVKFPLIMNSVLETVSLVGGRDNMAIICTGCSFRKNTYLITYSFTYLLT